MDEKFIQEFERVQNNIVYFIDIYYNKVSENKIELTDDEKQKLFDKYKGIPYFDDVRKSISYSEKIKELKDQGDKDWEIE